MDKLRNIKRLMAIEAKKLGLVPLGKYRVFESHCALGRVYTRSTSQRAETWPNSFARWRRPHE